MIYGWTYYPSVVRNDYDQCFTLIDCQEGAHLKELRSFSKKYFVSNSKKSSRYGKRGFIIEIDTKIIFKLYV